MAHEQLSRRERYAIARLKASRRDLTRIERKLNGWPRRVLQRKTPEESYLACLDPAHGASPKHSR
jgi:hypothetical protein